MTEDKNNEHQERGEEKEKSSRREKGEEKRSRGWMREGKESKEKKKLNSRIEKLEQEKRDLEEKCDRALADYHNLRQRKEEERKEFVKYSNERLLQELLPVFDNLKISLQHVSEGEKESAWVKGVEYVVKQFREILEENGVREIKAEGEKFDHETMEAVEGKGDTVVKEVKPGYMLNGKVIVPAKVVVEGEPKEEDANEQDGRREEEEDFEDENSSEDENFGDNKDNRDE